MKRSYTGSIKFLSIVFLFAPTISLANGKSQSIGYNFERKDSASLNITLTFNGEKSGSSILHLPNEWAGQKLLYKCLSDFKALTKGLVISMTDKPDELLLKYKPSEKVSLSYVLLKDWQGTLRYPMYFRPVIETNYFFFEGSSGMAYPDIAGTAQVTCKITYSGFAKTDFIGNSFFAYQTGAKIQIPFHSLLNSFFCAGNFRTQQTTVNGHHIVMAMTGTFLFTDQEAFSAINDIILQERKFWNDPGSPYFFALLLPLTDQGITGGTAHFNSFFMVQSLNLQINQGFMPVLSHEYFHTWIGQGLSMPGPEETYKWFSEGFTDYYSLKMLHLTGKISNQEYFEKLNQNIKAYFLSPYVHTKNSALIGRYWENASLKVLSYRRGLCLALMIDLNIADRQLSLDDLMRALYEESKPQMVFSKVRFDTLLKKYTDEKVLHAVNEANEGNNEPLAGLLTGNTRNKMVNITVTKVFDMGFDLEESKKFKRIIGLKQGSNAEKAGLIENMPITNDFSIWINNTEKPARVQALIDGKPEWITYIPVAYTNISVPQLVTGNN